MFSVLIDTILISAVQSYFMSGILEKIIGVKIAEVARQKRERPIEELKAQIVGLPKPRGFYQAIIKSNPRGINVIAEIKRASPSAGLIRADFDAVALAAVYFQAGADAISVLTDEQFFQGKLEYIAQVKQAVPLPVLRKDFIVDSYQVYQARAAQADAILLIAEALETGVITELAAIARSLGLTVLIEVHESASLECLRGVGLLDASEGILLGINNRNLKTMQVDLARAIEMSQLVGDKYRLVSESGIRQRADVDRLIEADINSVLIGETLMRATDIQAKYAELFNPAADA